MGTLTFVSTYLDAGLFPLLGLSLEVPIVIAGIEGTECYRIMERPDNKITLSLLQGTVLHTAQKLAKKHRVGAFLFEYAGFNLASLLMQHAIGVSVWDSATNARLLMNEI